MDLALIQGADQIMPRRVGLSLCPVAVVVLAAACRPPLAATGDSKIQPDAAQQFRITAVHAYLYYHERGEFDSKDIASGTIPLVNVGIGESDASTPSGAMLVIVALRGPDFAKAVPGSAALTLIAESSGHQFASVTARLKDFFSSASAIKIPFLVYGTPCDKVEIRARLEAAGPASSASVSLPFSCAE